MEKLPEFKNKRSGKIYTVFMITNQNSTREDFPETVVYFDEDKKWWSRPLVEFLDKNECVEEK